MNIQVRFDRRRGCGWRKPGGKYLIGGGLCAPCQRLPHFLEPCPTCGATIKPIRVWRWIGARDLLKDHFCSCVNAQSLCPLAYPPAWAGLLWIGDTFYRPSEFIAEAARLGISRRIKCVPKGFELGKTLVLLASRKVARLRDRGEEMFTYEPAIFAAFVPSALEYVVRGDESAEELQRLTDQGFTLVRIERALDESGGADGGNESTRAVREPARSDDLRPPGQRTEDDRAGPGGAEPGVVP